MTAPPALFVSHGSPMILIEPGAARDFLRGLAGLVGTPRAILVVSAHHDEPCVVVTSGAAPPTIHDFGGFPPELHAATYPAPGDPALAARIADLLAAAGVEARLDPARGFDHGAWVPMKLAYPAAAVPMVQLSIGSDRPPAWHHALGRAIAPLRGEGVLIVGSGSLTHNLREVFVARRAHDAPVPDWVADFADWIAERLKAGDEAAVLDAIERAPHGRRNHPTPDHLLPLFVAMGAGGWPARRLHASYTYGVLAMDAYSFG